MAVFILDASVTLAWFFEDEKTDWSEELLERLRQDDRVVVPAHWAAEVANGLLMAVRKKRIKPEQLQLHWEDLGRLPIDNEPALNTARGEEVLVLGEKHGLTVYDAAYLELARRYQFPLATLDGDLRKAAQVEGVDLL
jgi:predicted nucleic acid-binding protein